MAIQIRTEAYENSHGRKPHGRGLWFFRINKADGASTKVAWTGTYAEACRAAEKAAETMNLVACITVCP